MTHSPPESILVIAGKGVYPRLLTESARAQGVRRIVAVAFRRETDPVIEKAADEVTWVYLGQLGAMLDAMAATGIRHAVMAGQITPTHLFRIRMDGRALALIRSLKTRNAETIFGAVGRELAAIGIDLLPASTFMEKHMAPEGVLTARAPSDPEMVDVRLGMKAARLTSGLDIGQTVVIKDGTVLAVEAFEGTNATIKRAAALGGRGIVVVKAAKPGHDMRFDIPVVGRHTIKLLKKVKAAVLAVQAGRCILLEKDSVIRDADGMGLSLIARPADDG